MRFFILRKYYRKIYTIGMFFAQHAQSISEIFKFREYFKKMHSCSGAFKMKTEYEDKSKMKIKTVMQITSSFPAAMVYLITALSPASLSIATTVNMVVLIGLDSFMDALYCSKKIICGIMMKVSVHKTYRKYYQSCREMCKYFFSIVVKLETHQS